MSRCVCCNKVLTDYEMSLKGKLSGEYLNMSLSCVKAAGISYVGNSALKAIKKTEDDEYKPVNLSRPVWDNIDYED